MKTEVKNSFTIIRKITCTILYILFFVITSCDKLNSSKPCSCKKPLLEIQPFTQGEAYLFRDTIPIPWEQLFDVYPVCIIFYKYHPLNNRRFIFFEKFRFAKLNSMLVSYRFQYSLYRILNAVPRLVISRL